MVLIAAGYSFFATAPFVDKFFLTLANTSIFAAGVTLGFLFRRWNTTISNRLKIISISAVFIFFFLFEYTRINGTFQQRVVLIMSVLSVCVIWHIYELARLQKNEPSFFGKLLVAFSLLSLICYWIRIFVVTRGSDPSYIDLFSENVISFGTRWGVMAADVLTFIAINGYYMEKAWSSEKNALNMELIAVTKINTLNQELINAEHLNNELSLVLLEKNRLLTSLSSSVKSSRAGIMASSFVHEINQSLTAIRLNAEFLVAVADKPPDDLFVKNNLNFLIKDVDKITEIIENVKRVFHNNQTEFKDLILASIVESGVEFIKDECELKNIDLSVNVDSQLIVRGNQSQLEMVVLNLLNNAIDSLDTFDGKRSIVIASSQVNGNIHLIFEDSGIGVPLELQEKIFDLFRTTKNDGMGFGLWLSRAVMNNHRGSLTLDNDYSNGARFVIEFRASNNME
ncbi:MAG: HAMP domain-containing sensor histidine kinase [Betaproteobacteria bacterium]